MGCSLQCRFFNFVFKRELHHRLGRKLQTKETVSEKKSIKNGFAPALTPNTTHRRYRSNLTAGKYLSSIQEVKIRCNFLPLSGIELKRKNKNRSRPIFSILMRIIYISRAECIQPWNNYQPGTRKH